MNNQNNTLISSVEPAAIDQTNDYVNLIISTVLENFIFVIFSALFWALLGFILCIVVLAILKKKNLFKRDIKLWHYLSILQYPTWILIFVSAGLCLGTIKGVESQTQAAFDKHAKPYIKLMTPIINQHLLEIIPELKNDEPITIRQISNRIFDDFTVLNDTESGSGLESYTNQKLNWLSRKVGQWIVLKTIDAIVTYALATTGKSLDLEKSDMDLNQESFIDYNFQDFEDTLNELINLAFKKRIERFMDSVKNYMLLMALMCILGCLLDPLVYYCWKRYQTKMANKTE
ncbi:MAG: hypothetical protein HRU38_22100 [Saccharospirillaceae bacterium]|nr:hypothetical protein [Pseudomonadales bacterium]NRB81322.1 hypothetical protein [Saccharospirillaceae bacterium]